MKMKNQPGQSDLANNYSQLANELLRKIYAFNARKREYRKEHKRTDSQVPQETGDSDSPE